MEIPKITISGANEHTDIKGLIALIRKYYHSSGIEIELGIQVSPNKASYNSDRYQWLMELHKQAFYTNHTPIRVSLHVNPCWVEQICAGIFPLELINLIGFYGNGGGLDVERIQLNFLIGREQAPDMDKLYLVINSFNSRRFILTYNEANRDFIRKYYQRYGNCFDLLVDESHGEGKTPEKWEPVIFPDVFQSYSGGLSPDNIETALDSIFAVNEPDAMIGVDAEGKLKGDDGHLSLDKADAFVANILRWCKNSNCK